MTWVTSETVIDSATATTGALGTALTGAVAVGDWISIEITTPNNDTDCITSVACDKIGAGSLTRAFISPNQGLGERAYLYYGTADISGVPVISIPNSSGNNLRYVLSRGTKSAGTMSILSNTGNGAASSPSVTVNSVPANSMLRGVGVFGGSRANPSGYTELWLGASWNNEEVCELLDSGAAGNQTATWTGGATDFTAGLVAFSVDAGGGSSASRMSTLGVG